ncbi:MAG: Flp pilus assembly protein CpaB [Anaeromicrobium sp.]|jgi:pilus assembly protein CpaB|uniref:Flp pilus assembly protein CpaB n=1 Tax=Anaeromicrobium sp. TaxID=1929132 RepID=UPI0025DB53A1|nr:Flp pilus assembly protein CpaB [Anaeromicrobium sp.]MCT4595106.1 Flp pilus assembly protein CpaB [Anaeromicrobium sp.]
MRSKLILPLAVVMALITTYLFYNYIETLKGQKLSNSKMATILVANQDIPKNKKISKSMVTLKEVHEKSIHPQTIKKISEMENQIATVNMVKGEPILKHHIQNQAEETRFVSRKIKKGYRAVSVGVNMVQSVTNLIEPEDMVDVVFSEEIEAGNNEKIVRTELILEGARVLAIGRKMIQSTNDEPYMEYSSVTLELTQSDAVKLVNTQERGNIHLVLHSKLQ